MGFESAVASGTAAYGKFHAWFGAIIGTMFALLLIGGGLYMLIKAPVIKTTGKDGESPKTMSTGTERLLGGGMAFMGVIIILVSWVIVYFTTKNKTFASVYGGVSLADDVLGILSN